jgi:hypothetical protein
MKIRLLGAALATASLLFLPRAGWAQHGGHGGGGHAGGGQAGGGHTGGQTAGGHGGGQAHAAASSGSHAASPTHDNRGGDHDGRGDHDGARATSPRASAAGALRIVPVRPFLSRPYYVFRPRQRVGLGLYLGYAVPYPYSYFYPNAYMYPYSYYPYISPTLTYPYTTSTLTYPYTTPTPTYPYTTPTPSYPDTVTAAPSTGDARLPSGVGGVSFDITPGEAAVFVDGVYVGTTRDFSATALPLSLAAGRHHFELRAQSYETLAFDVDVISGQVVPYRGALRPLQTR